MLFPEEAKTEGVTSRALLIWPIFALAALVPCRAPAALAALGRPNAPREALFPAQRFRFNAGAPLLAPAAVAPDGMLCVGTVDGYVHALNADGSYRWSRTVQGAVARRPLFSGERWYIATSNERIYALTREGTLSWVFKPPSPVQSELAAGPNGAVYFVGADRCLYGVSAHGGVSLRVAFGELEAGPITSPDGAMWARNRAGSVLRVQGLDVRRSAPDTASEVTFPDPSAVTDDDFHFWHARADGVLELRVSADATPSSLRLTDSPLLPPAWSHAAHYAVVSSRSGLVFALDSITARQSR